MADKRPLRDRLVDFLTAQTDERDEMLGLLTSEERRVIAHHWYHIPAASEYQARPPEQPFPDRKMQQLRESALEKITFWVVERLQADRPTTLASLPPESN